MAKNTKERIGDIGEDEAAKYLENKNYQILERNYLRKWGEIDIISLKDGVLYFVEVKTISSNYYLQSPNWYRPEDKIHKLKMQRLKRAIQSYLAENRLSIETEWEFSVITIILKRKSRELYKLEHLENLII